MRPQVRSADANANANDDTRQSNIKLDKKLSFNIPLNK